MIDGTYRQTNLPTESPEYLAKREVLLHGAGATADENILTGSDSPGLFESGLDRVRLVFERGGRGM
jgi:hypothetical protein